MKWPEPTTRCVCIWYVVGLKFRKGRVLVLVYYLCQYAYPYYGYHHHSYSSSASSLSSVLFIISNNNGGYASAYSGATLSRRQSSVMSASVSWQMIIGCCVTLRLRRLSAGSSSVQWCSHDMMFKLHMVRYEVEVVLYTTAVLAVVCKQWREYHDASYDTTCSHTILHTCLDGGGGWTDRVTTRSGRAVSLVGTGDRSYLG